ncbi:MAG: hypothetical protein GWM87_11965 [Xanthomonadales bacterium]|nr:hypothetical protein [Xanthomonadales bacterium]NIX13568.1 hypothetical protein [Xanthomonadales bacterium]
MKKTLIPVSILFLAVAASAPAQETTDDSTVILPLEAQTCNLPAAPARIPDDAELPELAKAKNAVNSFQAEMIEYRDCLDEARGLGNLTQGNQIALNEAHNYSVEMEERVAEQFNAAVRAYKARQAEKAEG